MVSDFVVTYTRFKKSKRLPHKLDFSWTALTGTIPTEVGLLTDLQTLVTSSTGLVGAIPTEVGQLTNLKEWGKCFGFV